jgi:hypothetical protein
VFVTLITPGSGCECDTPALDRAYRITLTQEAVLNGTMAWDVDEMPRGRNMNNVVLLPNGKIIIINGAYVSGSVKFRDLKSREIHPAHTFI